MMVTCIEFRPICLQELKAQKGTVLTKTKIEDAWHARVCKFWGFVQMSAGPRSALNSAALAA